MSIQSIESVNFKLCFFHFEIYLANITALNFFMLLQDKNARIIIALVYENMARKLMCKVNIYSFCLNNLFQE